MKQRGVVTLVFDDGYEKVYEEVLPLLRQHRFPAVFAVPLSHERLQSIEQRPVKPWQEWLPVRAEGHELAAHSITHTDLAKLDPLYLQKELQEPAEQLQAHTIVYPGGSYNEQVVAEAQKYYRAGRTVKKGFESLPPANPMTLHSYTFTRTNFSVVKANALAIYAWLTGSWLIETYHLVDDFEYEYTHTVPLTDFKKHLAFLGRLPIAVKTIRDAINKPTP